MPVRVSMDRNGILCESGGTRVYLDPRGADGNSLNFVSHAHSDHLPSRNGGAILASDETYRIAGLRGFEMQNRVGSADGLEMTDSGHVLGSRGLLFDGLFYTGDICTRDRGFLRGARVPRCRTLITECTFGLPEFSFPGTDQILKQVNELVSDLYGRGIPVILMGYQLGKAQTLTGLFGHWAPLYLHDSVLAMNRLHSELGVALPEGIGHTEAKRRDLLDKRPWVMVAPPMSEKSVFVQEMKRYGAVTVGFSGWAGSRFPYGRRTDYSIQMSDHCDFSELVDMVIRSGAEQVYTVHGFVKEFAAHLQKLGISAQPLTERSLVNFA